MKVRSKGCWDDIVLHNFTSNKWNGNFRITQQSWFITLERYIQQQQQQQFALSCHFAVSTPLHMVFKPNKCLHVLLKRIEKVLTNFSRIWPINSYSN